MFRKIRLAETQADKLNLLQVPAFKRGAVIEGDITAFHNQSLVIFNGCFDDLPDNWPQIGGQIRVVALRGEGTIAASDQPHFQMIDGEIRIAVPLQYLLRQSRLPGVGAPRNQYNLFHIIFPLSPGRAGDGSAPISYRSFL